MNQQGVEHYDDVIASIIANGIKPAVTLFHWGIDFMSGVADFHYANTFQKHHSPSSIHTEHGLMNELWMTSSIMQNSSSAGMINTYQFGIHSTSV